MKRFFALCLTALLMLAFAVPAMAAEGDNLALDANVSLLGIKDSPNGNELLVDGEYNTDVDYQAGNWNTSFISFAVRYDVDGNEVGTDGPYYGMIILELKAAADLKNLTLVATDPDFGVGNFRLHDFDILTSPTGEAGSWTVAHEARDTRVNEQWEYVDNEDVIYPYWVYEADLADSANCKYVALAVVTHCNPEDPGKGQFMNLLEIEVYGAAGAATDAPATDAPATDAPATDAPATDAPATDAPATDAPATDPAPTETPDAPETFDFVIIPAIALAVSAAGVVVLKKKEN